ncbi:unnamed protein product [Fusarium venenatum]|uniref:F-box domain-containing protein n=1 Tax=Fusarium venenatum TaxID=56646 RepID=A0A2L2TJR9_9HYPO|nr:uncharacterized protein FVRRES_10425 [Fusarium venenatum]KAH6967029.1 hypothetical protein EDB82DRAFT_481324 [Fusarium venenatum]CEI70348.1 unnamed protein product [Fusarium venenatum]
MANFIRHIYFDPLSSPTFSSPLLSSNTFSQIYYWQVQSNYNIVNLKLSSYIKAMDTFQTLPIEIRAEILIYLHDPTYITSLIEASPSMLAAYKANRNYIRRIFYENEFGKVLMQDALGIILCPTCEVNAPYIFQSIKTHVKLWRSQKLAYPIDKSPSTILESLDRLYDRLHQQIQEFLTTPKIAWRHCFCYFMPPARSYYEVFRLNSSTKTSMLDGLSSREKKQFYVVFLRLLLNDALKVYANSHLQTYPTTEYDLRRTTINIGFVSVPYSTDNICKNFFTL